MKRLGVCVAIAAAALLAYVVHAATLGDFVPENPDPDAPGFALVELFGSENCANTPAAKNLIAALNHYAREEGVRLYTIQYHVKITGRHSWKDRFAQLGFMTHQERYLGKKYKRFTPCVVVNGRVWDGEPADFKQLLVDGFKEKPSALLSIETAPEERTVSVNCEVKGFPQSNRLLIVLVEDGLVSHIDSGPNSGESVHHERLARGMRCVTVKEKETKVSMSIPKDLNREKAHVVAILQGPRPDQVLAVASKPLIPVVGPVYNNGEVTTRLPDHVK